MVDTTGTKSLEQMNQDLSSRITKLDEIEKKIDATKKLLNAEEEKMRAHPDVQSSFALASLIYGVDPGDGKLNAFDALAWMFYLNRGWTTSSVRNEISSNARKQGEELLFQAKMDNTTYQDLSKQFTELNQNATELRALIALENANRAKLVAEAPLALLYEDLHKYFEKLKDKVKDVLSEMPQSSKDNLETKIENESTIKLKGKLYDGGRLSYEAFSAKNYNDWKPSESNDQLIQKFEHVRHLHTILTSSRNYSEKIDAIENVMKERDFEKEFGQQRSDPNKLFSSQSDSIPLLEKLKTTMSDIKQKLGIVNEPELKEESKSISTPRSR